MEGSLKTISEAGGFRVVVYEPVFGRAIRCNIPPDLMGKALSLFGRRVEVHGAIHYRRNGTIARVTVDEIVPFPPSEQLPTHMDVLGILQGDA